MWDVSDDPVDFDEAIAWFRELVPMSDEDFARLVDASRQHAFVVAGVAQLDIVTQVWEAIDRAVSDGTTFDDFVDAIGAVLESAWGGTVPAPGWRLETIFRTNVQKSYNAGRYIQATDPDTKEDRPYWRFEATLDSRTSDLCEECDGTIRPADDAWWRGHIPPLHHACRSTLITLTEEQARRMGGVTRSPSRTKPDGDFGKPPDVTWSPDPNDYPAPLRPAASALKKAANE